MAKIILLNVVVAVAPVVAFIIELLLLNKDFKLPFRNCSLAKEWNNQERIVDISSSEKCQIAFSLLFGILLARCGNSIFVRLMSDSW